MEDLCRLPLRHFGPHRGKEQSGQRKAGPLGVRLSQHSSRRKRRGLGRFLLTLPPSPAPSPDTPDTQAGCQLLGLLLLPWGGQQEWAGGRGGTSKGNGKEEEERRRQEQ